MLIAAEFPEVELSRRYIDATAVPLIRRFLRTESDEAQRTTEFVRFVLGIRKLTVELDSLENTGGFEESANVGSVDCILTADFVLGRAGRGAAGHYPESTHGRLPS